MKTYNKTDVEKADPKSLIGSLGLVTCDDLEVEVRVENARVRFGHIDLLVTPISGTGEQWIEKHRIKIKVPQVTH